MSATNNISEMHSRDEFYPGGKARYFHFNLVENFRSELKKSLSDAMGYKRERLLSKKRGLLLANLRQHGLKLASQVRLDDMNDAIGLIGEIIVEEHSRLRKYEMLWVKWRIGGTSKSKGIDLVAKAKRGSEWDLKLLDSKHLHAEVKGLSQNDSSGAFRGRFLQGMDGFDRDSTVSNLAGVVILMNREIQLGRAEGRDTRHAEQSRDFILSKLAQEGYSAEVVAIADSKYCNDLSLKTSIKDLQLPNTVGDHALDLLLLACSGLEVICNGLFQEFR